MLSKIVNNFTGAVASQTITNMINNPSEMVGNVSSLASKINKLIVSKPKSNIANELPQQVLVKIFGHLEYSDLKNNVQLVNTNFYLAVNKKAENGRGVLDITMFRDMPIPRSPRTPFTLHPCFGLLQYKCEDNIDSCWFETKGRNALDDEWVDVEKFKLDFNQLKVQQENATSPATYRVYIHIMKDNPVVLYNQNHTPITVKQVMEGLAWYYSQPAVSSRDGKQTVSRSSTMSKMFTWNGFQRMEITHHGLYNYAEVHLYIDSLHFNGGLERRYDYNGVWKYRHRED